MMIQVDFTALKDVTKQPAGLLLTLVINWLIKPFSMAALGWLFFKVFFIDWVNPETANEYIAGMILLGVAPCTAMVFVWSQLTKGDANYTLVQVAVNDVIMIFAFAPLAGLLLGVSDIQVPWFTLFLSVTLYVLIPLTAGVLTRIYVTHRYTNQALSEWISKLKPFSIVGLLLTVFILFALQSQTIINSPQTIFMIAIPLLLQTYCIFFITYYFAVKLRLPFKIAAPAAMIGTSNFFLITHNPQPS